MCDPFQSPYKRAQLSNNQKFSCAFLESRCSTPVGDEKTIGLVFQDPIGRRVGGYDGHIAAAVHEVAQDVVLGAAVDGHDPEASSRPDSSGNT